MQELNQEPTRKQNRKKIQKKNITNGEIIVNNIDQLDKVDMEFEMAEYDDTLLSSLELNPDQTFTYIENIKDGSFVEISEKVIQQRLQNLQKEIKQSTQQEDLIKQLNEMIQDITKGIDRLVFFFQGLLAGTTIMHLLFIYLDQDQGTLMQTYAGFAIRISQLFQILSFVSSFGAIFTFIEIRTLKDKSMNPKDRAVYTKSIFTMVLYTISYVFVIINYKYVSEISNIVGVLDQTQFINSEYQAWKFFHLIICISSVLGWFVSVNTTESNLNYQSLDKFEDETQMNSQAGGESE